MIDLLLVALGLLQVIALFLILGKLPQAPRAYDGRRVWPEGGHRTMPTGPKPPPPPAPPPRR